MQFSDLEFKPTDVSKAMVPRFGDKYKGSQALYHVNGYVISVISGFPARGNSDRPYELWSWPEEVQCADYVPNHDEPLGYLTAADVEWFINNECYKDYTKFTKYLQQK